MGYVIPRFGIAAEPGQLKAIRELPSPTNISELRTFMGMFNQLGHCSSSISSTVACYAHSLAPSRSSSGFRSMRPPLKQEDTTLVHCNSNSTMAHLDSVSVRNRDPHCTLVFCSVFCSAFCSVFCSVLVDTLVPSGHSVKKIAAAITLIRILLSIQ